MRSNLQWRFIVALVVPLVAGFFSAGYILTKFRGYEDRTSRMLSGDQRSVIQGHLIEARVKAAIEFAQASVNSEQANTAFREKVVAINDDVKSLLRDNPNKYIEDAKKPIEGMLAVKTEALEDIFVHYRNMKTTAFNTYRIAWANKWMTIAHNVGILINDLDNMPYDSGEKAAASIYAKIAPLVSFITRAPLAQESKLNLFGQLNTLKSQVARYNEALQRSDKIRTSRAEALQSVAAAFKKFNESQGKSMMQFTNEARTEVFKAIIAFFAFILFAMAWYWLALKAFNTKVSAVAGHVTKQFNEWISAGGNLMAPGFAMPDRPDAELVEPYRAMDQAMRRVAGLRKEDVLVKRLLNVPFVLINRGKQAIFWNSALSILGKVRALEETGPISYLTILRFTTGQGKAVDPIEKVFTDNKEVSQLALLRVGDEGVAVQAICTPVLGPDHQVEYVMVHLRDLRDENRRAENELDRQLECVRAATQFLKNGRVPPEAGPSMRRPVTDAVSAMREYALDLHEKSEVVAGHVETMRSRMSREANLKKTVHGRMAQLRDEVTTLRDQVSVLMGAADGFLEKASEVSSTGKTLRVEYEEIRRRGGSLQSDLKQTRRLIAACVSRLEQTEEISARVRANERVIRSILEKATVLNANNSILGSKRELTPSDVVTITENITHLMGQFDRSYRFIEQSVSDVERSLKELSTDLRDNLSACVKLAADDQEILSALQQSERLVAANGDGLGEATQLIGTIKTASRGAEAQIRAVESKIQHLVQIGQASLELQNQLELGFEGMFQSVVASESSDSPSAHRPVSS